MRDGELDASFYYGSLEHPDVGWRAAARLTRIASSGPAAWGDRVRHASWDELVQMPWILAPPISTLRTLVEELFAERGSSPVIRVEADNEAVMRSLVMAGGGVALMREDVALEAAAAGEVALWNKVRLETTLKFLISSSARTIPRSARCSTCCTSIWTSFRACAACRRATPRFAIGARPYAATSPMTMMAGLARRACASIARQTCPAWCERLPARGRVAFAMTATGVRRGHARLAQRVAQLGDAGACPCRRRG